MQLRSYKQELKANDLQPNRKKKYYIEIQNQCHTYLLITKTKRDPSLALYVLNTSFKHNLFKYEVHYFYQKPKLGTYLI